MCVYVVTQVCVCCDACMLSSVCVCVFVVMEIRMCDGMWVCLWDAFVCVFFVGFGLESVWCDRTPISIHIRTCTLLVVSMCVCVHLDV